jgi:general secretion pathway protein F
MPIFEYRAFTTDGATKTGVVDADTPRAARQRLRRDDLLVSELTELRGGARHKTVRAGADAPARPSLFERLRCAP